MGPAGQSYRHIQTFRDLEKYYLQKTLPLFRQDREEFFRQLVKTYIAAIKTYPIQRLNKLFEYIQLKDIDAETFPHKMNRLLFEYVIDQLYLNPPNLFPEGFNLMELIKDLIEDHPSNEDRLLQYVKNHPEKVFKDVKNFYNFNMIFKSRSDAITCLFDYIQIHYREVLKDCRDYGPLFTAFTNYPELKRWLIKNIVIPNINTGNGLDIAGSGFINIIGRGTLIGQILMLGVHKEKPVSSLLFLHQREVSGIQPRNKYLYLEILHKLPPKTAEYFNVALGFKPIREDDNVSHLDKCSISSPTL